jgi:intracellular septation protein
MRFLADYFPLLLFVAFKLQGIWVATAVAIVHCRSPGSGAATCPPHWLWRSSPPGGATLILRAKHSSNGSRRCYLSFAVSLAAGKLAWRRDLALVMKDIELPLSIWTRLTWSWVAFFVAMAATNWYVAFHFSTETWVDFKVWGGIGLFLLFALAQGVFLARHVIEPQR